MSNAFLRLTAGGMPTVPTTFHTDDGDATPAANILNVYGIDSSENNDNGISTEGSGDTVNVVLTNRVTGQDTTTDEMETTIVTFDLGATPGVYVLEGNVVAFSSGFPAGASYFFSSCVRTTGAAGIEIGTQFGIEFEELDLVDIDYDVNVSGNNLIITVEGLEATTINWNVNFTYRFRG